MTVRLDWGLLEELGPAAPSCVTAGLRFEALGIFMLGIFMLGKLRVKEEI